MTYNYEDGQGGDLNPAEEEVDGMAQGAGKEAEEVRSVRAPAVPILPSTEEVLNIENLWNKRVRTRDYENNLQRLSSKASKIAAIVDSETEF